MKSSSVSKRTRNEVNYLLLKNKSSGSGVIMLSLAGLGLTTLPQGKEYWGSFNTLTSLDLSQNNLEFLPVDLSAIPTLRTVDLDGNPLTAMPRMYRQWSSNLREYLSSIHQESEDFLERKLIIVGPEGVGKSSLFLFSSYYFFVF